MARMILHRWTSIIRMLRLSLTTIRRTQIGITASISIWTAEYNFLIRWGVIVSTAVFETVRIWSVTKHRSHLKLGSLLKADGGHWVVIDIGDRVGWGWIWGELKKRKFMHAKTRPFVFCDIEVVENDLRRLFC